jgi:hypothetical protein
MWCAVRGIEQAFESDGMDGGCSFRGARRGKGGKAAGRRVGFSAAKSQFSPCTASLPAALSACWSPPPSPIVPRNLRTSTSVRLSLTPASAHPLRTVHPSSNRPSWPPKTPPALTCASSKGPRRLHQSGPREIPGLASMSFPQFSYNC